MRILNFTEPLITLKFLTQNKQPLNTTLFYGFWILFIWLIAFQSLFGQVLNYETKVIVDGQGKKTTQKTILIQINDKENNWLSHVEIGHNPKQDFALNWAMITDLRGTPLRKLKKKDIVTKNNLSYQAFYQDDLITEFDLYWDQYPYQIEYSYTLVEREFLSVASWFPILYTNLPVINSSLIVDIPTEYAIRIDSNGELIYEESNLANRKILKWQSSFAKKPEDEIYSPSVGELLPNVSIIPENFKYGVKGSLDSWSSFGLWLSNLNEGTDELPLNEQFILNKLVEGVEDKREIIKKVYYYLQDQTKYINVAIDVGGLKSYPATYVCQNKYGDCKALTTYMKSMLKALGIKSLFTVVKAGANQGPIKKGFPSQQFNHVILAVPLESDTIWLENTSNVLPFNYLGTFTQNRSALAVNGGKSDLVQTPKLPPIQVLVQRDFEFSVTETDAWQSGINLHLRGNDFEKMRYYLGNGSKSDQEKILLDIAGIEGFDLENWELVDYQRDSSNTQITVSGTCPNQVREIGTWKVIKPLRLPIPEFESPTNRALNVRLNLPINRLDKVTYSFNEVVSKGLKLPENMDLINDFGRYSTNIEVKGKTIEVNENFTLNRGEIDMESYPVFYDFIQAIINYKKNAAILIP